MDYYVDFRNANGSHQYVQIMGVSDAQMAPATGDPQHQILATSRPLLPVGFANEVLQVGAPVDVGGVRRYPVRYGAVTFPAA